MFTNRKTFITVVLLAFIASFATARMANADNYFEFNRSFLTKFPESSMKFVGTYYSTTGGGGVLTFHADGTMEHMTSNMFAHDNGRRSTTGRGVWLQSGWSEIRVSFIRFTTMPHGETHNPGGLVEKHTYSIVFHELVDGRYMRYSVGTGLGEYFLPGQNPVTDDPVLMQEWESNSEGYRLELD